MAGDVISNWVEKAKSGGEPEPQSNGVVVIKRDALTKGNLIMEIAERLRPWLTKMFEGVRDENGMLVQPARVRGIALNVAQSIVNEEDKKNN